jgi:hypothetical protein
MSYDDDDEDGGWVERICNDRNYLVIGDGESLVADWPGWLRGIAETRQELFDEAEALGLDGADYASPPDRDDTADVEGFLEGLGVSVTTDFIERTGCSSHDGFAYVRKKAIPALEAREERRIAAARRRLLKDAVKRLTPDPAASYAERFAALKRMLAAQDEEFVGKVARLEEARSPGAKPPTWSAGCRAWSRSSRRRRRRWRRPWPGRSVASRRGSPRRRVAWPGMRSSSWPCVCASA